jgi:hypothetical protein
MFEAKKIVLIGEMRTRTVGSSEPGVVRQSFAANYNAMQLRGKEAGASAKAIAKQGVVYAAAGVGVAVGAATSFVRGLFV